MELSSHKVFRLQGKIQHYAWGGKHFLSHFLHVPNPEGLPFAEYWLGAHANAPSEILDDDRVVSLYAYISGFAKKTLGNYIAQKFGKLPYLLKILDVHDMLSIQVHPNKHQAEKVFATENEKGIALNAAHRNYKDDNHKPELMLALSDFWLLHGFKPVDRFASILKTVPELNFLSAVFDNGGYEEVYRKVMEMEPPQVMANLRPLLDRIVPAYQNGQLDKADEHFWAARAGLNFGFTKQIDPGIFSIYFFNLLKLEPGEAIFQDAGLPHAYLEGQNVEIMANSDNVLRGGLTPKWVDVQELMKLIVFGPTQPAIIRGKKTVNHIEQFNTPAPDFELGKILLPEGNLLKTTARSAEIFIVWEGAIMVTENLQNGFFRRSGEAFISFDKARYELKAMEDTIIYRAAVPIP